jgi:hypothetical protein
LVLVRHRAGNGSATADQPGKSLLLWGLDDCKRPARRLPFTLSASVMAFAGAKTFSSLAQAARWLPVSEEQSAQRDTNGGRQKKSL